jgi:two-component system chemotaxis response regulator CheY
MSKVLFIDDSLTTTLSLKTAFDMAGHEATTAHSGPKALELLRQGYRPDIIFTDINMPGMDGIELIVQARKIVRFLPIVVLSAESQTTSKTRAREAGASGWVQKPAQSEELLNLVRQLVPVGV